MSVDLEAVKALCEAATKGPWWTDARYDGVEMGCSIIAARSDSGPLPGNPTHGQVAFVTAILSTQATECEATAKFIAAARSLVPAMASEIEADRAGIKELEELNASAERALKETWDYGAIQFDNVRLRALLAEAGDAIEKIYRTPAMPFPDPGAHSWRAWGEAVYRAYCDIQRTARTLRAKIAAELSPQTDDELAGKGGIW